MTKTEEYWFKQKLNLDETKEFVEQFLKRYYATKKIEIDHTKDTVKIEIVSKEEGFNRLEPKRIEIKSGLTRQNINDELWVIPAALKSDAPYEVVKRDLDNFRKNNKDFFSTK